MEKLTDDKKVPSKEEIMKVLNDQIGIKKLQAELQKYNTSIAVERALELEAFMKIAHLTSNKQVEENDDVIRHTVTEDDLNNNPDLADHGIKVGDEIGIQKDAFEEFILPKTKPQMKVVE